MSEAGALTIFLDELHHDALEHDVVKARYLMDSLPELPADFQQLVFAELKEMDAAFQVDVLGYLVTTPSLSVEVPSDELMAQLTVAAHKAPHSLPGLLADRSLQSKTPLLDLCDVLPPEVLEPQVRTLLAGTTDVEEIVVLLAALGRLGSDHAVPAIDEYLYAADHQLVSAAIDALAQIETQPAIQALGQRLGNDVHIDVQIMEHLADLSTSYAIELIVQQLAAASAYSRTRAKEYLIRLKTHAVPVIINLLPQLDEDAQVHALNVMGAIGDEVAIQPIRHLLHGEPVNPNVRFAAYEALGFLPSKVSGYVLAAGLADVDESVRIAAAKAIERNLDKRVSAGLANLTREPGEETRNLVKALVEARAEQTVVSLTSGDAFAGALAEYLNQSAHPDTAEFMAGVLQRNGCSEVLDMLVHRAGQEQSTRKGLVYVVDDSRMILNIYKSLLFGLGYEVETFEFPRMALQRISEQAPDIVFTDLNMPELDGIELTKAIRQSHGSDILPVIMVTTQNEGNDSVAARAGGVNQILHKPFTEQDLRGALAEFLPG